ADVEYSYHRLSRPVSSIITTASPGRCRVLLPPPLQADVEYYYHRLYRLMLSILTTASPG
ncbi:hypothetical protein A2U01_0078453, partial [Trifolium medium]|nr:hypothetical protein [Trifolium medium]